MKMLHNVDIPGVVLVIEVEKAGLGKLGKQ